MELSEIFPKEKIEAIRAFYRSYEPCHPLLALRRIPHSEPIDNLFYGDSITAAFPLHEFFPEYTLLNRGIPGDTVYGLYDRLEPDLYAYSPRRVFLLIGINGIEEPAPRILDAIRTLTGLIRSRGSEVVLCSILPLRNPDRWNRFQYQEKIVSINAELRRLGEDPATADGFLDYHAVVRDENGELAAPYAREDGTHVTLDGYFRMAEVVRPFLLPRR